MKRYTVPVRKWETLIKIFFIKICYNTKMKNKSLSKILVNSYGFILILILIFSHFDLLETFRLGSYPLGLLFELNTGWKVAIIINFGLYGFSILCILIQARLLYYIGNVIEKAYNPNKKRN